MGRPEVKAARSPALRLILHRVLVAVPVLLGVTLLTFFILHLLPGNAAQQLLGAEATAEQIARFEAELNLDRPAPARYFEWLTNTLTGDLGRSLASGQPVTAMLSGRIAVSLELVTFAFALSLGLAIPVALIAAHRANGFADRLTMLVSMVGLSLASYVLALVLVLVFSVRLGLFPSIGFAPLSAGIADNLRSLTLPALAIALPLFGLYTRFLRGDLLEQMHGQDYVTTALAKGLGPWRVLVAHAFRNSVFGLLTLVGLNFGALVGGTVIVEQIFALPGIGQLLLQAINTRDAPVVQSIVLLLAVVTVLTNLTVDLLYTALDPRIRHGHS